jgi:hypothetical protein
VPLHSLTRRSRFFFFFFPLRSCYQGAVYQFSSVVTRRTPKPVLVIPSGVTQLAGSVYICAALTCTASSPTSRLFSYAVITNISLLFPFFLIDSRQRDLHLAARYVVAWLCGT